MLAVAAFGVIVAHPTFDSSFPAFAGFAVDNGNGMQYLIPGTVYNSCLWCDLRFHSLVSSGTTSKQLDKETDARPIAYGGMLLECVLAVLTLCAMDSLQMERS